jgi:polar amino acid transport system substrate-binding protein
MATMPTPGRAAQRAIASAVVAAVAVAVLLAGCGRRELGGTLARVERAGVLRWGADLQGGEPFLWRTADGRLVGFEVEIMDAVARRLGVRSRDACSSTGSTWCRA